MAYKRRDMFHALLGSLTDSRSKHVILPLSTIMEAQRDAFSTLKDDKRGNKCRLDIAVRYMALEACHGENHYGLDLYRKMQEKRIGTDYGDVSLKQFTALAESFHDNGYDSKSEIELGSDLMPIDGTHRIVLALYYGIKELPCLIRPYKIKILYSLQWFERNGFTEEELHQILSTMDKLTKR